ncbi:hypothetical protein NLJ89_g8061 [Agrocybe chaxingu]|uniref:DUF6699 domain-containing protein n=1 Tax=Agrocybe chaxingu TaxID=84603 RepID=A0A9W8MUG3_9AGAR|nr:hypothetical protein NLJ89_g8061 [Agrocybe chaxingu]
MTSWPPPPAWVPTTAYVPTVDPRFSVPTGYPQQLQPSPPWFTHPLPAQPDPYRTNASPAATAHRSIKYPSLNPALAEDTTMLRYDLKQKPSTSIMPSIYYHYRAMPVIANACHRLRIICKAFPWQIDISTQGSVTCGDVWEAVYAALQESIADSEWGFLITQEGKRAAVEKGGEEETRVGTEGLERDEDFAKLRQLPFAPTSGETWVLKLIS